MCSAVNIRLAKKDEYDFICQAFKEWYFPYEPLTNGFRIKEPTPVEKEYFFNAPQAAGLTLVATLPEEDDKIVGFLVNAPGPYKYSNISAKEEDGDDRHHAFLGFIESMLRKQQILDKFADEKIFKHIALAVDPAVRGMDIGYKLFESAIKMAKDLGYSISRAFCTSKYSIKIAERHSMNPIASIEYKEYKDSEGNQVFVPSSEHTHATLFVKVLNE